MSFQTLPEIGLKALTNAFVTASVGSDMLFLFAVQHDEENQSTASQKEIHPPIT